MESNEVDRDDAVAQLAALQADRAALADRVVQPWWYDVALGLLLFGFVASYAFDSLWVTIPALVVFCAGLGALVQAYKRITGVWVAIDSKTMAVWCAIYLPVLAAAFVLAEGFDQHWVMVPAGAVLGVAVTVLGRRWGRAYAAELRSGQL
jgi:ABC-type iron transport system FetAB permease component